MGVPRLVVPMWKRDVRAFIQGIAVCLWREVEGSQAVEEKSGVKLSSQLGVVAAEVAESPLVKAVRKEQSSVELKRILQTELFALAPTSFQCSLFSAFRLHFAAASVSYTRRELPSLVEEDIEEEEEAGEDEEEGKKEETCQSAGDEALISLCRSLGALEILLLCEPILHQVCSVEMELLINSRCRYVQNLCQSEELIYWPSSCSSDSFESGRLKQVNLWLAGFAFSWLRKVLEPAQEELHFESVFSSLCTRLVFYLHEVFASLRVSELFDIIIDFPDSTPALEDLRECLLRTNQVDLLISSLTAS